MELGFERMLYLTVVAMNADDAKAFGMPHAAKVVLHGQADPERYKFGARTYFLFETLDDYNKWLKEQKENEDEQNTESV